MVDAIVKNIFKDRNFFMTQSKTTPLIFKAAGIILAAAAAATLIPYSNVDSACILGYKALCPFSPVSTAILLYCAVMAFRQSGKQNRCLSS